MCLLLLLLLLLMQCVCVSDILLLNILFYYSMQWYQWYIDIQWYINGNDCSNVMQ